MLKYHQEYLEKGNVTHAIEKVKLGQARRCAMKLLILMQRTCLKEFMMLNSLIANGC